MEKVELYTHTYGEDKKNFYDITPKGSVPALQLDDGSVLTEGAAVLQYIADQAPAAGLAPANGTMGRYRVQEMLNFLASDVHSACFGPLWNPATPAEVKTATIEKLNKKLAYLDGILASHEYLTGAYSVADLYLFVQLGWAGYLKLDISAHKNVVAFIARVAALPEVKAAVAAEYGTTA